ncbi:MAG: tetratricopeptide repeat protein [Alphaproteobacteria bacterium]
MERAVHADPREPRYHQRRGLIARGLGRDDEAFSSLRLAVQLEPGLVEAHRVLGDILRQRNRYAEAAICYHAAVDLDPDNWHSRQNLANCLEAIGDSEAAEAHYREILRRTGLVTTTALALAVMLNGRESHAEALDLLDQVVYHHPTMAAAHNARGIALAGLDRATEAEAAYREALVLDPHLVGALSNLGCLLQGWGRLTEAIACHRAALDLKRDTAVAHSNLGLALTTCARVPEAIAAFMQAMALDQNNPRVHSNFLLCLSYDAAGVPEDIAREHRLWSARHAAALTAAAAPHLRPAAPRDPEGRLRVGYVSADFRTHSVAYFAEPVIAAHDRRRVEVFCYADFSVSAADGTSDRIRAAADHWTDITGRTDADVAATIRADGVDILVDLSGHTAGHRLLVFARRPAPIQVSWIGYPPTTGLTAMDYRFTDAIADPPGETEHLYAETLVRLPGGFLCYRPPETAPEVAPPPMTGAGCVTFGSFNNLAKINPPVAEVWGEVLRRVPGSRLMLKSRVFNDAAVRADIEALFAAHGVPPERLLLLMHRNTPEDHLDLYRHVDIGLDPFPYNGTTTSCEALWMGVPVITLTGASHVSRVGTSLLTRLGLGALIARTPSEYVSIAEMLAGDLELLSSLRGGLRSLFATSGMIDAGRFTTGVEAAYAEIWRRRVSTGRD